MANLIGTAGHVDHGKTTLIKALTGIDADRLPEEKKRGLTIDIGFAYVDLPEVGRASIVDVPGHERFLTNMLVGALGIDVALLCVAADSSVMPQTVEHFQILELLPVERLVVALTRKDLVDQDTLDIAREEVMELLEPTRFKDSPIVPVSAMTGEGLDELKARLVDAIKQASPLADGDWYLPIDRVFAVKGHGVVVTGTLAQGVVKEGDKAVVMPQGIEARVRSVQSHDEPRPQSERGKRTALNLAGVKAEEAHRGQIVGAPGSVVATDAIDGTVRWIKKPNHGSRVRVSIGADECIARAFHNDNDPSLVQLRFERPVAAVRAQPFIVRHYSPPVLLGGGRVTVPVASVRKKSATVTSIDDSLSESEALVASVAKSKGGTTTDELCRLLGKSPQALGDTLESLKSAGALLGFAGLWMTPEQFDEGAARYLAALSALHEAEPAKMMQPREAPLKSAGLAWSGKPFDRIVTRLAEDGRLRAQGTSVAVADFRPRFSDKQRALLDRVLAEMSKNGISVPSTEDTALKLNVPKQAVEEIVRLGLAAGEFVRIEEGIAVPAKVMDEAVRRTRELFVGKRFSASQFREALGTTRKYAIPLLEYLDAKGVTKRQGDERVLV